jgi:hypothetical protein
MTSKHCTRIQILAASTHMPPPANGTLPCTYLPRLRGMKLLRQAYQVNNSSSWKKGTLNRSNRPMAGDYSAISLFAVRTIQRTARNYSSFGTANLGEIQEPSLRYYYMKLLQNL